MPIYEYYCETCDKVYEIWQKITDPPRTVCEVCGGPLQKNVSLSAFHLKGSGWYATDYAPNNGSGKNGSKPKTEEKKDKAEGTTDKDTDKTADKAAVSSASADKAESKVSPEKTG